MLVAEVKGIGFPNKGAELLLNASMARLRDKNYKVCTEPYSSYDYKVAYPLYSKMRIGYRGFNCLAPFNLLPNYVRSRLGFIKPSEVNLILDASGYAYGDPWTVSLAKNRLLQDSSACSKVILPQSLGPFTTSEAQWVAKEIAKKCELIYAREKTGAKYFEEATGKKIKVVPDITFCLKAPKIEEERDVIIIPNFQVEKREGDSYVDVLTKLCEKLHLAGRSITILNHEGIKDKKISEKIIRALEANNINVEYIEPQTGLDAKSIIANAKFVVTSRYHGLISSLSSQVPCIAVGWSFKYDEAMALFDLNAPSKFDKADDIFDFVTSEDYTSIFSSEAYANKLKMVQEDVNAMWKEVFELASDKN
ncbi:polysaccharide pyruvyl transferase family protein [Photobacterium sp. SDRW27]|uniref:polysaccharide pyruvyl transferase family protein n=1 Tax=Photobacterium obscurum TaxID=2829490 RepID=UPI002242C796|nr:polysaccharide pyruvyl transferase family protein [Photobacterium obscurum]MCW8328250.1 polysaccharide pyruvyl transferase family protein [Photobacterium obscurum]